MSEDVKVIYRKLNKNFIRKGYININHIQIESREKLAEVGQIFRDPRYETFRMIYMKDNKIVGQEAISSKVPNYTKIFTYDENGRANTEKCFYKMRDRIKRLDADGYYMVHNHPSGKARASRSDVNITKIFKDRLDGFKGHLIVNSNSYAWIDVDDDLFATVSNEKEIKGNCNKIQKLVEKNGIYNVPVRSREDLVNLMNSIKNSKDYSTAIIINSENTPRMILDIPNRFLNMKIGELRGYFQNISRLNGGNKVLFATDDWDTFEKSVELLKEGILQDSICYELRDNKLYLHDTPSFEFYNLYNKKLFDEKKDNKLYRVWEDEQDYINNDKKEKKLRVLIKEVGKDPRVIKIDNTLEIKQKLVNGLIEVIPYGDALLICNEEGKHLNLKTNIVFDYDYIAGDCFVVGDDYENSDFKSLTNEQIEELSKDLDKRSFKYNYTKARNQYEDEFDFMEL